MPLAEVAQTWMIAPDWKFIRVGFAIKVIESFVWPPVVILLNRFYPMIIFIWLPLNWVAILIFYFSFSSGSIILSLF